MKRKPRETDRQPPGEQEPFDLQSAQRELYGLWTEQMDFDEASIAKALRDIAEHENLIIQKLGFGAFNFLVALADALEDRRAEWKLTLSRSKRGPFKSLGEHVRDYVREEQVESMYRQLTEEGVKGEAAVAIIRERTGQSRATIFKSVKRIRACPRIPDEITSRFASLIERRRVESRK